MLPDFKARLGVMTIDRALDLKQRVNTPDRLKGNRGDFLCRLSLADIAFNIGELEEFVPRVGPTPRRGDRPRLPLQIIELVIAGIGISLKNALPPCQMRRWVLAAPIMGEVKDYCRRRTATPRSIIAQISRPSCQSETRS